MATTTKTKQRNPDLAQSRGQVAVFQPPRLPYHPAIEERFGINIGAWKVLVDSIFPAAKSVDSVVLALAYCQQRGLDVFKRPVHIVPMWSKQQKGYIETVWPGISELRTTAFRTKAYAGLEEPVFGPPRSKTFKGIVKGWDREPDRELQVQLKYPEYCQITVQRELNGNVHRFVGPKVYWVEAYARIGQTEVPNEMWQRRAIGQLEKCAEAAALRRAFPEELGNEYSAEEMEGQVLIQEPEGAPQITPPKPSVPKPPTGEIEWTVGTYEKPGPDAIDYPGEDGDMDLEASPETTTGRLDMIDRQCALARNEAELEEIWDSVQYLLKDGFPPDIDAAEKIHARHMKRLGIA
jgi:phage recombination protein Bet